MRKIYQIIEYGSFVKVKNVKGYTYLPEGTFDALEDAIQVRKMAEADGPKRFCVVCGNPIPPESVGNVLTCTSECSNIRMQQNSRKREQRKRAEQQKFCAVCGKPIQKLTRGTAKFCSEACRDKAYRAKKEGTE